MYVHPAFRIDRAASLAFAAARGFGLVVACDDGRPAASPLPVCLDYANDGTPRLGFHVARNNPLAGLAAHGGRWLVAVMGADAYVSPDWYASHDQVPTWLYETVHLGGPVRLLDEHDQRAHLDALGEKFESWLAPKPPWTAGKIAPGRRQALMKGIVGIEMVVDTVEGSLKLNQHKSDVDHVAVTRALARQDDAHARTIAARMVALRPHLDYDSVGPSDAAAATVGGNAPALAMQGT
jgi:transcriptional regulator